MSEIFFCLITWFETKNVYSFREIKIYHSLPARAVIEMCKFSSSSILIIHLVNICIFETHEKNTKEAIEILFHYFFFFCLKYKIFITQIIWTSCIFQKTLYFHTCHPCPKLFYSFATCSNPPYSWHVKEKEKRKKNKKWKEMSYHGLIWCFVRFFHLNK